MIQYRSETRKLGGCLVLAFVSFRFLMSYGMEIEHDALNRVVRVTYASGGSVSYSYDKGGNRIQMLSIAPNRAPVAGNDNVQRPRDTSVKVDQLKILDNDVDADGDILTIIEVGSPTLNGAEIIFGEGIVLYTPPANFNEPDSFTYTVSDGRGGTSTATVSVSVRPPGSAAAKNLLSAILLSNPPRLRLRFSTIPGKNLIVETSPDLTSWTAVGSATSGLNGMLVFEDTDPAVTNETSRFYRLRLP